MAPARPEEQKEDAGFVRNVGRVGVSFFGSLLTGVSSVFRLGGSATQIANDPQDQLMSYDSSFRLSVGCNPDDSGKSIKQVPQYLVGYSNESSGYGEYQCDYSLDEDEQKFFCQVCAAKQPYNKVKRSIPGLDYKVPEGGYHTD